MAISATYSSSTIFTVTGNQTALFHTGRRVKANCGADGYKYGTIASSAYTSSTAVTLKTGSDALTNNLTAVEIGIVGSGSGVGQSPPEHAHGGIADGGYLPNLRIASASGALIEDNQSSPSGTRPLGVGGYLYATRVYNAIWNDVADFQPVIGTIIYGRCYYSVGMGMSLCTKRRQMGVVGIASDTYGFGVGARERCVPIAIAGWVLAYVDHVYPPGTPLVNNAFAELTKASLIEKLFFRDRIVGYYDRDEMMKFIVNGKEKVAVNKRHWVRVK